MEWCVEWGGEHQQTGKGLAAVSQCCCCADILITRWPCCRWQGLHTVSWGDSDARRARDRCCVVMYIDTASVQPLKVGCCAARQHS